MLETLFWMQALAFGAGEDPAVPRPVTVELTNGAKIDGTLIERDGTVAVLRIAGGEVRLAEKTIRRVVDASPDAGAPTEGSASPPGRVRIDLPSPGAMSFEVPAAWTETRIEGRDLGLTDPTQSLFLGMSSVADPHSLWNLTASIKKEYDRLYPGFVLGKEKYLVKGSVRIWEIEFTYRKDSNRFREIQMLLDFGDAKRIFTFTTAAERFGELAPGFRHVAASFRFGGAPAGAAEASPASPAAAAPGSPAAGAAPAASPAPAPGASSASAPSATPVEPEPELDLGPLLPIPEDSARPCPERGI